VAAFGQASVDPGTIDRRNQAEIGLWRELRRASEKAQNLPLYAGYNAADMETIAENRTSGWESWARRYGWGYGFRPARVAVWFIPAALLFAVAYWIESLGNAVGETGVGPIAWKGVLAMAVSLLAIVMLPTRIVKRTKPTNVFQAIVAAERLVAVGIVFFVGYSMSTVSPMMSEFIKKMVP
jgi:hypothetical protein